MYSFSTVGSHYFKKYSALGLNQSRKFKSRYDAMNRFQEPSLELSSKAT